MKKAIERFSIAQMTSNESGKTSASGTMGVLICLIGTLCFALGCVGVIYGHDTSEIITQSIVVIGTGAALLGYRKSKTPSVDDSATIDYTYTTKETLNTNNELGVCTCNCNCERCAPITQPLNS
jgi:hypothetical protein